MKQCEQSISNEPAKITVRDELEVNIQKYSDLLSVITDKKDSINEVITCGRDLASKANSKVGYYKDGVELLETEWSRVTELVEERRVKLETWSQSFGRYEEVRGAAIRAKDDCEATLTKLEAESIEEVNLDDELSLQIENLSTKIDAISEVSDSVVEEYKALSKTPEQDEYISDVANNIEELRAATKSFEKRVKTIQANKGTWHLIF